MGKYKIIISTLLILAILSCFFYLYQEKTKFELMVKDQEVQITELKGKIIDQETELGILRADKETKEQTILALEEKIKKSTLNSKQTIDNLIELYEIITPGSIDEIANTTPQQKVYSNSAAGKKEEKSTEVIDAKTSKKLIDLRNNIYRRYQ